MTKKTVSSLISIGVIAVSVLSCVIITRGSNNGLVEENAFRTSTEIASADVIYLDDEAIALADSSGDTTALRSEALRAYNLVNETRANEGVDPLTWDQGLESTSSVRAEECSSSFSHTRPNGSPWYTVDSQIMGGENLAFGFNDAGSAVDAWMDSPTHRDNVLYPDFTKIAISVYVSDDGTYYWAQEFGY